MRQLSFRFSNFLLVTLGVMLIALGVTTMVYPDIMSRYGLSVVNVHGKSTIIAVIGGAEIGLGIFVLFGRIIGASVLIRLSLLLCIFMGLLIGRLLGVIRYYPELPDVFFREVFAEILIAGLCALGLYFIQRRNNHRL